MQILAMLREAGWHIEESNNEEFVLPDLIQQRYPSLPAEVINFLFGLKVCANSGETAWFLCQPDYKGESSSAFRWNEIEMMELEWAQEDDDMDWQVQVREFWNEHFPFFLSVKSDYAYFAISLRQENYGAVMHGFEPEFLEVSEVSSSFQSFLVDLAATIQGLGGNDLIRVAV